MTGKEALDDYKDFGKIKGESITSNHTFVPSDYHYEWKKEKNIEDELIKYKLAFEILKYVVIVSNLDGTYLLSVWGNKLMPEPVCYLEKEQGELLEELMGCEKN